MFRILDWFRVHHTLWMQEAARLHRIAHIWLGVAVISTVLLIALLVTGRF